MSVLSDAIKMLLDSEQPLNASAFTPAQRKQLEKFAQDTRQITISKQGRSTLYQMLNRQCLLDFLRLQQPLQEADIPLDAPDRSRNIGTDRNSKKGLSIHACTYFLMKSWDAEVVWRDDYSVMYPAKLTLEFGVAALQLKATQSWQCNRPLLLVENQALFDRTDWLPKDFNGCLVYYAGQLSGMLLQWLGERKRCESVILFPDYDGIGLTSYVRLAEALHFESTLQFYWLPDWISKIPQFGNPDLWRKTRTQFENALEKLQAMNALDENFISLGQLSQHYGKALEQEVIWL